MTNFPAPPLSDIPLHPGQFLGVDGFEIGPLATLVRAHPDRLRLAMSYVDGFGGFGTLSATPLPFGVVRRSITVKGNPAHIGDDEQFALTDATFDRWLHTLAVPSGGKPGSLYEQASNIGGMAGRDVWYWSAHYGWRGGGIAGAHLCGPNTCGLVPFQVHATQCYDVGPNGENVDISICSPGFLGVGSPLPPLPEDTVSVATTTDHFGRLQIVVHLQSGEIKRTWEEAPGGHLIGVDPKNPKPEQVSWVSAGNPGK